MSTTSSNKLKIEIRNAIEFMKCSACKKDAKIFKDQLSKKEYQLSGLCQKCQDTFFTA